MLLILLAGVATAYLALCALVYIFQDRLIFLPSRTIDATPAQYGWAYDEVKIAVLPAEKIYGWYFPSNQPTDSQKTILFCHGNAGNISHRLSTVRLFLDLGANVLLFDYRGYGRSDGRPSEANAYADGLAAFNWLVQTKGVKPENIFLFGRSLGGAVAVELATRVKCGGVILESTFTSVADLGQKLYPFLPIRPLVRTRFDSVAKISSLTCPVLVAHSSEDELIPFEMGQRLYDSVQSPRRFVELSGRHNELGALDNELYRKTLEGFLRGGEGGFK